MAPRRRGIEAQTRSQALPGADSEPFRLGATQTASVPERPQNRAQSVSASAALVGVPTGRSWRLRFDGLPPSPNARMHHMARARTVKQWREAAMVRALAWEIPPLRFVRISATITRKRIGVADEDNDRARLKPLVDGLRDAGVIPSDTRNYVEYGPVPESRGEPGVWLVIEEQALLPVGREEGR